MKKIIALLSLFLVACCTLALAGCGASGNEVKSIKVNIVKSVYYIDEFNLGDYTLTVEKEDGTKEVIPLKQEYVDSSDFEKLKNVGTHTLKVSYQNKDTTFTVSIKNHEITGVIFQDKRFTYDGTEKTINAENVPEGATVTYDISNTQINAGEYKVTATVSKLYHDDKKLTAKLIIEKSVYDISGVKFEGKTVKYDGNVHSIFITGTLPQGVRVEYQNNEHTKESPLGSPYTVTAKFIGDYVNYEKIPDKTASLTITREKHTVTFRQQDQQDVYREVMDLDALSDIPTPVPVKGYNVRWEEKDLSCVTKDIVVNAILISEED